MAINRHHYMSLDPGIPVGSLRLMLTTREKKDYISATRCIRIRYCFCINAGIGGAWVLKAQFNQTIPIQGAFSSHITTAHNGT